MILFWSINACMLLLALAFVVLPIIRRHRSSHIESRNELNIHIHKEHLQELENDFEYGNLVEEEFNTVRNEIRQDLISDITEAEEDKYKTATGNSFKTIIPLVIVLPVFVIITYLMLGDIGMVSTQPDEQVEQSNKDALRSLETMVANLSLRLQQQPEDGEGWLMLARSYVVMNKYQDAIVAYHNARKYVGDNPRLLADYAEALILANNNNITEEAVKLFSLALQANPDEPKALWIAGYTSFEQGDVTKTLHYWQHLLDTMPPGSKESTLLQENINRIKQNTPLMSAGKDVLVADDIARNSDSGITPETGESSPTRIDVQVNLASTLSGKVKPDDTVFIFARASTGPRMPLAIVRKQVKDLPVKVTLDDSMAMSPAMRLSEFKQVVISARVSKSGDAIPRSGDLSGTSTAIHPNEISGVKITIDQVVP